MSSRPSGIDRRRVVWGGVAVTGLAAGYLMFGPSDQRRALQILREVVLSPRASSGDTDALREARVRAALSEHTLSTFRLTLPELGVIEGRAAVLELLERVRGISIDVAIEQSDVVVDGETCQATLLVAITLSTVGERRRQVRTLSCDLRRNSEPSFKIASITASEASREQPEARP